MVKSADEIDRIRRSVDTNSKAYAKVLTRLKPTASEKDIAAEIEFQQRRSEPKARPLSPLLPPDLARLSRTHVRVRSVSEPIGYY